MDDAPACPFARSWWIEPGRVLGGRYPGTTDPGESRAMLAALVDAGVRCVVNLQEPREHGRDGRRFPDYRATVAALAGERGVTVACLRFAVPDMGVPAPRVMRAALDALGAAVGNAGVAYVHCWGGHGRTGTLAGCWLVERGMTAGAALDAIRDRRAHDPYLAGQVAPQTREQVAFVRGWAASPYRVG